MNENIQSNSAANSSWLNDQGVRVPRDTSMLPDSENVVPAAIGVLNKTVQGAHAGIDRFAESAKPVVRQVGDNVAAATEALHAKTDQLRVTRDEWAEGARNSVRSHPLTYIAAAFALGAVVARITR